ncbi:FAD-dependent oxidoreductase [Nocardia thailandica]|uniref:FAD-dependent oxidoreductase n=1 Tax=Nocardia thailandica TaxID=257275 RepID=UPI00031D583E|nr:FAD-dependent oxidoreductase [Nocardia thailandica]
MTYVITQRCCNDASCVAECPVDCIRPRPEDPEFATAEMLYIDPGTCIDCGACFEACPVDAVYAEDELPAGLEQFSAINAGWFQRHPLSLDITPVATPARLERGRGPLRVAIVGTGPAACYTAEQLLARGEVEIDMIDRLPTPWGLLRHGVAPDHDRTRGVAETFTAAFERDAVRFHLGAEVGTHITHAELAERCHAVVYAVGASGNKALGIPGENLAGSVAATEFVAWYNGHPDYADRSFDLSAERAVVVGNGNVALDVARILTLPPDRLARTDIADHALEALRDSAIREVVVLGRRGPLQAGYTGAELLSLGGLPGVDLVVDPADLVLDPADEEFLASEDASYAAQTKWRILTELAGRPPREGDRRIVLRFWTAPTALTGPDRVTGLEVVRTEAVRTDGVVGARATEDVDSLETGLVLRAVGYRGNPVPGLPFDTERGVLPTDGARVLDDAGTPLPGVYATGWIKRGARGVIGTNRTDATDTVTALVDDFRAGLLPPPAAPAGALTELLRERRPDLVDRSGWAAVDRAERAAGATDKRSRRKFTTVAEVVRAARGE